MNNGVRASRTCHPIAVGGTPRNLPGPDVRRIRALRHLPGGIGGLRRWRALHVNLGGPSNDHLRRPRGRQGHLHSIHNTTEAWLS